MSMIIVMQWKAKARKAFINKVKNPTCDDYDSCQLLTPIHEAFARKL